MLRSSTLIAVIPLCLGCMSKPVETRDVAVGADAAEIYGKFLDDWTGREKYPINVSVSAKAPSAEDLNELSNCADKITTWLPVEPIDDLTSTIGQLPYVRLVDPDKWSPQDPGDLIARGNSVESAVASGFAHGLLTFSAIVFDSSHETAAFKYSFVCGRLCGNGGTATFKKKPNNWVKSGNQCGGWISSLSRPPLNGTSLAPLGSIDRQPALRKTPGWSLASPGTSIAYFKCASISREVAASLPGASCRRFSPALGFGGRRASHDGLSAG